MTALAILLATLSLLAMSTAAAAVYSLVETKDRLGNERTANVAYVASAEGLRAQLKEEQRDHIRTKTVLDETRRKLEQVEAAAVVGLPDSGLVDALNRGLHPDDHPGSANPDPGGGTAASPVVLPAAKPARSPRARK